MPYCSADDVTLGSMELPRGVDVDKVIEQQAEHMDSVLGRIFQLPFTLSVTDPDQRPYALLLKKVNAYLAIGDIIIKAGGPRQDTEVLAYGMYYVKQANAILNAIENGKLEIPFLERINGVEDGQAPAIFNRDSFSRIEEFYRTDRRSYERPWVGNRAAVKMPWE